MTASEWIQRSVSLLRTGTADEKAAATAPPAAAARKGGDEPRPPRSLAERMEATLRRHGEALPLRALRKALEGERGIAKEWIRATGYWKHSEADAGA